MKKSSKSDTENRIKDFFLDLRNKSPEQIKKMKKLAMGYGIKLREKRKMFCKKCFGPYSGKEKVRIKRGTKMVQCENCRYVGRWKVK